MDMAQRHNKTVFKDNSDVVIIDDMLTRLRKENEKGISGSRRMRIEIYAL
jgi:hypothetical protein